MEFTTNLQTLNSVALPNFATNSQFLALSDDNTIVSFDLSNPEDTTSIEVTGVKGVLLGIDTRPANGMVYGLTTANDIYTIDPNSGEATYASTLDIPFDGGTISGFDFNPAADRLRLVGDNDQDFRINVETGEVIVDGMLAFAEGDVNDGVNPNVTAAAYTNSFDGTTSTQLYDIDTLLNDLVLQDPPNDGTLVTVGDLGVDFDTLGGFDIVSSIDGENAAFAVSDGTLYRVDLATGEATDLGSLGDADSMNLQGFTIAFNNNEMDVESDLPMEEGETDAKVPDTDNKGGMDAYNDTLIDLSDMDAQSINFTVSRKAHFASTIGFYEIANTDGDVVDPVSGETIAVGDSGYLEAAIASSADIALTSANGSLAEFSSELAGDTIYAPYIVVDGTVAELADADSSNDPTVYFTYLGSNTDGSEHIRSLDTNTLGFEDLPKGGDMDFNDMVVEFELG